MKKKLTYQRCLSHMAKCNWKLDDVLPIGSRFDLSKHLLPQSLTHHHFLQTVLSRQQLHTLNHITAKSYLNFFHLVEEFIILKVDSLAKDKSPGSDGQKAFEQFHHEEIKHQKLFERAIEYIDLELQPIATVVNFEDKVAKEVLKLHPVAVILLLFHLEIISQDHYLQSVKDNNEICNHIANILQYHWIEESQHANLDKIELYSQYANETAETQQIIITDFYQALTSMMNVFMIQAELDLNSLSKICGAAFSKDIATSIIENQYHTYIKMFILSGLYHRSINKIVHDVFTDAEALFLSKKQQIIRAY